MDSLYIEWILVEFGRFFIGGVDISGISRLIEFSRFPKYGVDISGIFRLVDLSKFFRF